MKAEHDERPVLYLEFDKENGIADLARKDWQIDMQGINDRIVAKFDLPDTHKHYEFLFEAVDIIQGFSRIELRDTVVVVPADLTEFKKVKAKFQKVCDKLDELSELVFKMRTDATADMLIQYFDEDGALAEFNKAVPKAMSVFAQIDGFTGTAGNRSTGPWAKRFLVHCQRFWAEEKGGGTRPMFESERRTAITFWIEDVYEELRKSLGINTPISKIKTVARNVAAYRTPQKPNIEDTPDGA